MNTPNKQQPDVDLAADVLLDTFANSGLGLLVTACSHGKPHATWMASVAATDANSLVTLTSPDSRKVANIRENPETEWLFTSPDQTRLIYLHGESRVVEETVDIKRYWRLIKEKDQAYFLDYSNSGIGFAIVETQIAAVTVVFPKENRKVSIAVNELWQAMGQRS